MRRAKNLFNQIIMFPYCYCLVNLLLLLLLVISEAAGANNNYHTISLTSLLPQFPHSTCDTPLSKDWDGGAAAIEVRHRDHPCASTLLDSTPLSKTELLTRDELRVRSIQARATRKAKTLGDDGAADLPAQSGDSLGTGNHVVSVGIGSPAKTLALIFDTGSDITWTQCRPCATKCYPQKLPVFDPKYSKTYANVPCSSPLCSALNFNKGNCSSTTRGYVILYGDHSTTEGYLAKERLSLTSSDAFDNFIFGCGQKNQGLFGKASGLLGLAPSEFSIVYQTARKYRKMFSYCLPTPGGERGYLEFGPRGRTNVSFTPMAKMGNDTSFYYIQVESISVGGEKLNITPMVFKNSGMIIDSGTVVTRLPPAAYGALKSAFVQKMKKYRRANAFSILDTCFDFSKTGGNISYPVISFEFRGKVTVDIPVSGVFIGVDSQFAQVCLAFAGNKDPSDLGIFGNMQQQTMDVVYDVANWRLGFGNGPAAGQCT